MVKDQGARAELHGIQMLRAIAALAVVVHHTLEQSGGAAGRFSPDWLTTSGAGGVDIFFVISGFIMLYVSFGKGGDVIRPGPFLFRRITRIYPLYWGCCIAMLAIAAAGFLASHRYDARTVAVSLLLLPGARLINVAWTLVYEMYFYLLFAVMLTFRSRRVAVWGTTAAILVITQASRLLPAGAVADFLTNPLPAEFCMGLLLASAYLAARQWRVPVAAAIVGLAAMAAAPLFVAHATTNELPPLPRVAAWGLPAVLTVAAVLGVGPPRRGATRLLVLLGDASYALYLTHVFVMIAYGRLIKIAAFSALPQLPVAAIVVVVAIVVGLATHLLVEKPLLRLIRRLTHRRVGRANPAMTT